MQCVLQQGITALGLADVQRQHRQRAGDSLRYLEQGSRRPGQKLQLQLANRRAFATRRDLPDVQRHLDDTAAAPPHLPKGAREGGDKTRRQRPKQCAVRVQVLPRRGVKCAPGQFRAGHGHLPFAALAQGRVAAAAHLQGLQPLRLGFAALAPQPQSDALLVQVLLGRVEVDVVQMKLRGLAARQHRRARQHFFQTRRVGRGQRQFELDFLRLRDRAMRWFFGFHKKACIKPCRLSSAQSRAIERLQRVRGYFCGRA